MSSINELQFVACYLSICAEFNVKNISRFVFVVSDSTVPLAAVTVKDFRKCLHANSEFVRFIVTVEHRGSCRIDDQIDQRNQRGVHGLQKDPFIFHNQCPFWYAFLEDFNCSA